MQKAVFYTQQREHSAKGGVLYPAEGVQCKGRCFIPGRGSTSMIRGGPGGGACRATRRALVGGETALVGGETALAGGTMAVIGVVMALVGGEMALVGGVVALVG